MGRGRGTAEAGTEELAREHLTRFHQRFGNAPGARGFYAPGRVNLMGAHLDYSGGPVMPMAVDRGTFVALRPRADALLRLATTNGEGEVSLELAAAPGPTGTWVDYPLGVILELVRRAPGGAPARAGLDVLFGGNLPVGAGLSSSASICVATALAVDAVWELGLEPFERVRCALDAERGFVGVQCGIMDPYAVGLAREDTVLWLDCKDASYEHLEVGSADLTVAVADSGVRRQLAQGEFNRRVDECRRAFERLGPATPGATCLRDVPLEVLAAHAGELDPVVARRARHVLEEVARTFAARDALLAGDLAGFGAAMLETHESLRVLYEVSIPELDCLVEAARACEGAWGARLTGAGFGGCVVAVLRRGAEGEFTARATADFRARFGRAPSVRVFRGDPGPREV